MKTMNELMNAVLSAMNIHILDLDDRIKDNEPEGTFKELYDDYAAGNIKVIKYMGRLCGISYNGAKDIEEDNIAKMRFEKRYANLPVQAWIEKILDMQIARKPVEGITEDEYKVVINYSDGTTETICKRARPNTCSDEDYKEEDYDDELPDSVTIDPDDIYPYDIDLDDDKTIDKAVREYLRETYNHYLARGCELDIDIDDEGNIQVDGIEWGRKR